VVSGQLSVVSAVPDILPSFVEAGFSAAQLEAGRKLFAGHFDFFYAAQALDHLPEPRGIEIAFAGRSNAGKSSLLNALTSRKALARVSHQPGRTRQLNFFQAEAAPIVLVDMPGYGYAEAPKAIKRDWQGLMLDYLRGRPNLARVLLLLDARVELKTADKTVLELLDQSAVAYQLVLTKADSVKPAALARKQEATVALAAEHPAALAQVLTTSSHTGAGMEELRASIAGFQT
jgi:GTP-binding protein